jgi:hypothetical protein
MTYYQPAESVTLWGFPNQLHRDSRWQPRGLPSAELLRCGLTIRPARFAGLRSIIVRIGISEGGHL